MFGLHRGSIFERFAPQTEGYRAGIINCGRLSGTERIPDKTRKRAPARSDRRHLEERVRDRRKEIDNQVAGIQARLDAVTEPFQNQRGRIVVITYKLETARKGS